MHVLGSGIYFICTFSVYNFRLGGSWKSLCREGTMTEIRELPPRPVPLNGVSSSSSGDGEDTISYPGPSVLTPQNAPHPRDESDIEALRACWAPKIRETVASRLPGESRGFCCIRAAEGEQFGCFVRLRSLGKMGFQSTRIQMMHPPTRGNTV